MAYALGADTARLIEWLALVKGRVACRLMVETAVLPSSAPTLPLEPMMLLLDPMMSPPAWPKLTARFCAMIEPRLRALPKPREMYAEGVPTSATLRAMSSCRWRRARTGVRGAHGRRRRGEMWGDVER